MAINKLVSSGKRLYKIKKKKYINKHKRIKYFDLKYNKLKLSYLRYMRKYFYMNRHLSSRNDQSGIKLKRVLYNKNRSTFFLHNKKKKVSSKSKRSDVNSLLLTKRSRRILRIYRNNIIRTNRLQISKCHLNTYWAKLFIKIHARSNLIRNNRLAYSISSTYASYENNNYVTYLSIILKKLSFRFALNLFPYTISPILYNIYFYYYYIIVRIKSVNAAINLICYLYYLHVYMNDTKKNINTVELLSNITHVKEQLHFATKRFRTLLLNCRDKKKVKRAIKKYARKNMHRYNIETNVTCNKRTYHGNEAYNMFKLKLLSIFNIIYLLLKKKQMRNESSVPLYRSNLFINMLKYSINSVEFNYFFKKLTSLSTKQNNKQFWIRNELLFFFITYYKLYSKLICKYALINNNNNISFKSIFFSSEANRSRKHNIKNTHTHTPTYMYYKNKRNKVMINNSITRFKYFVLSTNQKQFVSTLPLYTHLSSKLKHNAIFLSCSSLIRRERSVLNSSLFKQLSRLSRKTRKYFSMSRKHKCSK